MSESQVIKADSVIPEPDIKVAVVQSDVDYVGIEFKPGQYFIQGSTVVAFILEVNEYAAIFQSLVSYASDEDMVFDFEAGHNIMSISGLRTYLERRNAKQVNMPENLVSMALETYKSLRVERLIRDAKILPRDEEEHLDLLDRERYSQNEDGKRIIPPPRKYRKRKGLHWLAAGVTGDKQVCKLWDPEQDDWVMLNGKPDIMSRIGFISGYISQAFIEESGDLTETPEEFSVRVIDMLKQQKFAFDAKFIKEQILAKFPETEPLPVSPLYTLVSSEEGSGLQVYSAKDRSMKRSLWFKELMNGEFIPKQEIVF